MRVRMLQGRAKRGQGRWSLIKKTSLASMNSCRRPRREEATRTGAAEETGRHAGTSDGNAIGLRGVMSGEDVTPAPVPALPVTVAASVRPASLLCEDSGGYGPEGALQEVLEVVLTVTLTDRPLVTPECCTRVARGAASRVDRQANSDARKLPSVAKCCTPAP